jgi:hypothetical protein
VMMMLFLMVVFMFFSVSFDTGVWFFDHREAQNQSEAAVLAGIQHMPVNTNDAAGIALVTEAVDQWLDTNRSGFAERSCLEFEDNSGDGRYDSLRVCVRRQSSGFFSKLAGIGFANVSASAKAMVGGVTIANVMPWAIIAPDPECGPDAGRNCVSDVNGDGDYDEPGDCNADFYTCPWGLNLDRLYTFKVAGGGNTGIIDSCGNGANGYQACLTGENTSGFFEEGGTVFTGLQGGSLGVNTDKGLSTRFASESSWDICDVEATPAFPSGYDADGKAAGLAKWGTPGIPGCEYRLVVVPILASMPSHGGGSTNLQVLGVATFGVAKWNRTNTKDAFGTEDSACTPNQGGKDPDEHYNCGMVWGYLYKDLTPPDFLLQQIGNSQNPLAPVLIALVE